MVEVTTLRAVDGRSSHPRVLRPAALPKVLALWLVCPLVCPLASAQVGGNAATPAPIVATTPSTAVAATPITPTLGAPPAAGIRPAARREDGTDSGPAEPLPLGLLVSLGVLSLLSLGVAAAALYLVLRRPSSAEPRQHGSASPNSAASITELQQELQSLKRRLGDDSAKFDSDVDRFSQNINSLWAEMNKLGSAVTGPAAPAARRAPTGPAAVGTPVGTTSAAASVASFPPPPRPSIRAESRVIEGGLRTPLEAPSLQPDTRRAPEPPQPPEMSARRDYAALQDAAAAALNESTCDDARSFSAAVLARLPPDLMGRKGSSDLHFSCHSSAAGLVENFLRPDFISVLSPSGQCLLLPLPSAGYAYSHVRFYDGDAQAWPRVERAALCVIGSDAAAQLIEKGRLG